MASLEGLPDHLANLNDLHRQYLAIKPLSSWNDDEKEEVKNNFTYHSNKIEGLTLSYGETIHFLKNNLVKAGTRIKDIYDLANHKTVLDQIFQAYDTLSLSEGTVKRLHAELMKDDAQWEAVDALLAGPGQYKTEDNYTYRAQGVHKYLEHGLVPKTMEKLIEKTRSALENNNLLAFESHPVKIIAQFHSELLQIHPFSDGNGRIARLITTLLLLKKGYPPLIIETNERDIYFDCLIKSETDESYGSLVYFFAKKLAKSIESRIGQTKLDPNAKSDPDAKEA